MTEPHRPWEVFGTTDYTPEMLEVLNNMPMIRIDNRDRRIEIKTALSEPPNFNEVETITVTRDDLLARRQELLDRLGLTLDDLEPGENDCHCCPPARTDIAWRDFDALREIAFLLGEDREPDDHDCEVDHD